MRVVAANNMHEERNHPEIHSVYGVVCDNVIGSSRKHITFRQYNIGQYYIQYDTDLPIRDELGVFGIGHQPSPKRIFEHPD